MYWFIFLFHSGGLVIYITGKHEYDRRSVTYLCGKQANISILIMGKTADIEALGSRYHWLVEFNNKKFLADFKALPEESFLGIWLFFLDLEVTHISMGRILACKKIKMVLHQPPSQETLLLEGEKLKGEKLTDGEIP